MGRVLAGRGFPSRGRWDVARGTAAEGGGGDVGWAFDPSVNGYDNIVNRAFNTKALESGQRGTGSYPDKTTGSEGWDDSDWDKAGITVETDATAPISASNVYQWLFEAGTTPDGNTYTPGGGTVQTLPFTGAAHGSHTDMEMYVRFAMRVSADYENHPDGTKMILHITNTSGSKFEPFIGMNGSPPYDLDVNFQGCPDNTLGNIRVATGAIARGTWYLIETQLIMDSSFGAGDGVFKCWVDGVLKINKTDVNYLPNGSGTWFWDVIRFWPTWGGQAGTRTVDFESFVDQCDVWGKA